MRDIVYGALDGCVTTFAIIAGVAGADLDIEVAVVLGLANIVADGFSMGASNYLGLKSELQQDGRSVQEEKPHLHALATFLSFLAAGSIPLAAFLLPTPAGRLALAAVVSGVVLFVLGAARSRFIPVTSLLKQGLEMLLIGALAGAMAYAIGAGAQALLAWA